jgi:hypothetical protein
MNGRSRSRSTTLLFQLACTAATSHKVLPLTTQQQLRPSAATPSWAALPCREALLRAANAGAGHAANAEGCTRFLQRRRTTTAWKLSTFVMRRSPTFSKIPPSRATTSGVPSPRASSSFGSTTAAMLWIATAVARSSATSAVRSLHTKVATGRLGTAALVGMRRTIQMPNATFLPPPNFLLLISLSPIL